MWAKCDAHILKHILPSLEKMGTPKALMQENTSLFNKLLKYSTSAACPTLIHYRNFEIMTAVRVLCRPHHPLHAAIFQLILLTPTKTTNDRNGKQISQVISGSASRSSTRCTTITVNATTLAQTNRTINASGCVMDRHIANPR